MIQYIDDTIHHCYVILWLVSLLLSHTTDILSTRFIELLPSAIVDELT